MADRAALVTGASSGIGLAIAKTLGEEGYALTVSARRPEKLEKAAEGLRGEGFEVEAIPANMAEEDHVVAIFAAHRQKHGRLDVLVNNAGVGIFFFLKKRRPKRSALFPYTTLAEQT